MSWTKHSVKARQSRAEVCFKRSQTGELTTFLDSLSVHLLHMASFHRRGPLSHVGKSKTGSVHNGHMSKRWPTAAVDDTVCIWQTPAVVTTGRKTTSVFATAAVTRARVFTLKSNSGGTCIHLSNVGLLSSMKAFRNKSPIKLFPSLVVVGVFHSDLKSQGISKTPKATILPVLTINTVQNAPVLSFFSVILAVFKVERGNFCNCNYYHLKKKKKSNYFIDKIISI